MADEQDGAGWDVFVSHASEDKGRFVEPLVAELRARGLAVWYDRNEVEIGDNLRTALDEGLRRSRFGVLVLSPRAFKYWPEAEWAALLAQEEAYGAKRLLPIRLDLSHIELVGRSPILAGRVSASWEDGVPALATRIHEAVRKQVVSPGRRPSPVHNLPSRPPRHLFGRDDDMATLAQKLQPGRSVRLAASIEGLAGVGKTELALHLVNRLATEGAFPGGIFWLDAERPDLTSAWGGPIADGLAVSAGPIAERAAAAVRIVSGGLPALVVLDNVERWARDSTPAPLPAGSHVSLLVTTRQAFLAGRAFEHHALDCLPPQAARQLLLTTAGRQLSDGLDELLDHLGGHALAVELAGAYLHEFKRVSPREYLARRTRGDAVDESVRELVRYERTVKECFDATWTQLSPAAAHGLAISACFAPEDASLALLEGCGVSEAEIRDLERFHLLTTSNDRWRMHRLVREHARAAGTTELRAAAQEAFVAGCVQFSGRIDLATGFRVYASDGLHLEEALALERARPEADATRLSYLLDRLGVALQSAGDLRRSRELLESALGSDLRNLGEDHPSVATSRSNLALALWELGDLAGARDLLEAALASALRNLGEDHLSVAISRSNLAIVLEDLGDLARARDLLEAALASALRNLGEDHPSVAISRSNLAGILRKLGDLARARDLLEAALASDLRNFGEDHPSVATRRFSLAFMLGTAGDARGAAELLERALAAETRTLGPDHPSTSYTRVMLAKQFQALGEYARAGAEAGRALRAVQTQPPGSWYRLQVERVARTILDDST
jgi:tetratricopeptide (TPR) repeat protein